MAQSARKALVDYEILIIGTGFAGIGMAIRLQQEGFRDFVLLEKADEVGGVWRDNRYPGCACDIQSHLYSFSFEPNPNWTRMFAPQQEILDYLRACAQKHDLTAKTRFEQYVVGAAFDEAAGLWTVRVADTAAVTAYLKKHKSQAGQALDVNAPGFPACRTLRARVLISGMGGLSTPAYPAITGLDRFKGKAFHSQHWDHDYDLRSKRVAVIGTGASAIQFVPQIQKQVAHLDLYQRTPPWIMPKPDRAITKSERRLFRKLPQVQSALRTGLYWMLESRAFGFVAVPQIMDLAKQMALRHIRHQIKDPQLQAKVTPDCAFGCKRVLISDDYYPALNQPNLDLITTDIKEVRSSSIVTTDGIERPVDAIIFGTGFKASDPLPRGLIFGRKGQDILDGWEDGPEAYKGTTVAGFPNLFLLVGPNTGLGHNSMVFMIESQIAYVLDALKLMRARNLKLIDVRPQVQAQYNRRIQKGANKAIWSIGGCHSWYLHPKSGKNVTLWPKFTWQYRLQTRQFDADQYQLVADVSRLPVAGSSAAGARSDSTTSLTSQPA